MRRVASTRVCSSMSTVTVVPALRAAAQIRAMFSVAVFIPCSARPQADRGGLDRYLGPAAPGQPGRGQLAEQPGVLGRHRGRLIRVLGVLAQVVQGDQQPAGQQSRVTSTASAAVSPATYRATRPRVTGAEVISCRVRSLPDAASSIRRSTIRSSSF